MHQRKPMRLANLNYGDPHHVFFLTICAREGTAPFANPSFVSEVISSLLSLRRRKGFLLYSYCLMLDHLHLVASPSDRSGSISDIVRGFKTHTTRVSWQYGVDGKLWQKSFYDHIVRKDEDLRNICEYVMANPVRKGLAKRSEDWPYSGLVDPLPL